MDGWMADWMDGWMTSSSSSSILLLLLLLLKPRSGSGSGSAGQKVTKAQYNNASFIQSQDDDDGCYYCYYDHGY